MTNQYWIFGSVLHNLVIYNLVIYNLGHLVSPIFVDILHKACLCYKQILVVYFKSTLLSVKLETKIRINRLDVTHTLFFSPIYIVNIYLQR